MKLQTCSLHCRYIFEATATTALRYPPRFLASGGLNYHDHTARSYTKAKFTCVEGPVLLPSYPVGSEAKPGLVQAEIYTCLKDTFPAWYRPHTAAVNTWQPLKSDSARRGITDLTQGCLVYLWLRSLEKGSSEFDTLITSQPRLYLPSGCDNDNVCSFKQKTGRCAL